MKNCSPIYHLLHREMKACAGDLLKMSQNKELCHDQDPEPILDRLVQLHQFASKVRADKHYRPLSELKSYLENTMLGYQDEYNRMQSMRLSETIFLLTIPSTSEMKFKPCIVHSLKSYFVRHFLENSQPGWPLFRKLREIKHI
jgi:hypothetical protein